MAIKVYRMHRGDTYSVNLGILQEHSMTLEGASSLEHYQIAGAMYPVPDEWISVPYMPTPRDLAAGVCRPHVLLGLEDLETDERLEGENLRGSREYAQRQARHWRAEAKRLEAQGDEAGAAAARLEEEGAEALQAALSEAIAELTGEPSEKIERIPQVPAFSTASIYLDDDAYPMPLDLKITSEDEGVRVWTQHVSTYGAALTAQQRSELNAPDLMRRYMPWTALLGVICAISGIISTRWA